MSLPRTAVAVLAVAAVAADWPQFKGPTGAGVSAEANLPEKWDKESGLKWKADLPARGISSPVVAGGRVYVTCSSGTRDDRLHVLAFDAATGKQLWHRQLAATGGTACHPKTCMAAPTPVADADGVYALFATGDLAAFDRDGSLRWYRSLTGDYPSISNQVGMASSPVLAGDKLIVPMDNAGDSFLAAVDTKYGTNLWKADRPKHINWVTPVVRAAAGKTELIFQGPGELTAYDADSGDKRWATKAGGSIPSPALAGDTLFVPGGGVSAFKLTDKGVEGDARWKATGAALGMGSPLAYDGRVYAASGQGVVACVDPESGKVVWKDRVKGAVSASPVAGDGKVYVLNETGGCTVIKAGGDAMEILSTNELGEETLATPALANGTVFIRGDKHLFCVGSK